MDLLSDVLQTLRLTGSIFFMADLHHPWSFSSPKSELLFGDSPSKTENVSLFHILTEGEGWFQIGNNYIFLRKGEAILFPHGCEHIMCSDKELQPVSVLDLLDLAKLHQLQTVSYGQGEKKTRFICGYQACDQKFNPLMGALPDVFIVSSSENRTGQEAQQLYGQGIKLVLFSPGSWLEVTLQRLSQEAENSHWGSSALMTRLTELLYIEILRTYSSTLATNSRGWLAGIQDGEVGQALEMLHDDPARKWCVEELASEIGVSRSAFARKFAEIVGLSPMRYLTNWRMQLSKKMLLDTDLTVSMIADKVGYDSDVSFSRAFSRYEGKPPISWRKKRALELST